MESNTESSQPKKCFCARCFRSIDPQDKVDIEDQSFHKFCSMCCVCRTIPKSLKMFYGHVFCNECFKSHVLPRFRGDCSRMHSHNWWMQWAPGVKPQTGENKDGQSESQSSEQTNNTNNANNSSSKCMCARCLQCVDDSIKIEIDGQFFHRQCAVCCCCHTVPTNNVKIYFGQVFCEKCFHRQVLNQDKDNPTDFLKDCMDHWQNSPAFAEQMKEFMASKSNSPPIILLSPQPTSCGFGNNGQEWYQKNEAKKCA